MTNCCDDYGNCNQGRDCPARVARIGKSIKTTETLQPSVWRRKIKHLTYWLMMAVVGLTVWPMVVYLVFRA